MFFKHIVGRRKTETKISSTFSILNRQTTGLKLAARLLLADGLRPMRSPLKRECWADDDERDDGAAVEQEVEGAARAVHLRSRREGSVLS